MDTSANSPEKLSPKGVRDGVEVAGIEPEGVSVGNGVNVAAGRGEAVIVGAEDSTVDVGLTPTGNGVKVGAMTAEEVVAPLR